MLKYHFWTFLVEKTTTQYPKTSKSGSWWLCSLIPLPFQRFLGYLIASSLAHKLTNGCSQHTEERWGAAIRLSPRCLTKKEEIKALWWNRLEVFFGFQNGTILQKKCWFHILLLALTDQLTPYLIHVVSLPWWYYDDMTIWNCSPSIWVLFHTNLRSSLKLAELGIQPKVLWQTIYDKSCWPADWKSNFLLHNLLGQLLVERHQQPVQEIWESTGFLPVKRIAGFFQIPTCCIWSIGHLAISPRVILMFKNGFYR